VVGDAQRSQAQNGFAGLAQLAFDVGKFFSAKSSFCAKLVVKPPFGNALLDNFLVDSDFVRPVVVSGNFNDGSVTGLPCRVFPGLAHVDPIPAVPDSQRVISGYFNISNDVDRVKGFDVCVFVVLDTRIPLAPKRWFLRENAGLSYFDNLYPTAWLGPVVFILVVE